jgi:hypothetical protein
MFSIYKTNGIIPQIKYNSFYNLNILRLDLTEEELFNFRLNNHENIKYKFEKSNSKLKNIGFISRDFSQNRPSGQLSQLFFEILSKYKNQYNIYFYCLKKNLVTHSFREYATIRQEKNLDLLSKRIYDDKIDILIDMQGHMHSNFNKILLEKPAPIQLHWLGYPGTTGLKTVDYLIADKIVIPDNSIDFYSEKIAYMPNCYQCNNKNLIVKNTNKKREEYNIPEDAFVFCNFNSDYKIDKKMLLVWFDIINSIDNSVLVYTTLKSSFKLEILELAKKHGVNLKKIIYVKRENRINHINRLNLFNLGLDNYRLNGHTTSSDLICGGTPFITIASETYHNRVAKSILISLDLEELVCYSFDDYKKLAIKIATDKEYYSYIKQKVFDNRDKYLFNTELYTINFVNLLENIWIKYNNDNIENKFIWNYYSNIKLEYKELCKSELKGKELLNYVNNLKECLGFTQDGFIFSFIKKINNEENEENQINEIKTKIFKNIWLKENIKYMELTENFNHKKINLETNKEIINKKRDELNKDYNLPLITGIIYFNNNISKNSKEYVNKIINFYKNQTYLHFKFIIVIKTEDYINKICLLKQFIEKNYNINFYIEKNKDEKIDDLIKNNNINSYYYVIDFNKNNNYNILQELYDNKIKNDIDRKFNLN